MKKVILITGASSGMGQETLKLLVSKGHTVYGTARKQHDLETIQSLGGHPLQAEMTEYGTLDTVVATIIKKHKRIDVLFNNAGYGLYGTVEEIPLEVAKHQLEVNLFGLAKITQLVIPHMRKAGSGTIINTSSMGGKVYTPFGAWYHASKHALEGWSDCLRLELRHFGIDVVVVEPGSIETPWNDGMNTNLAKYSGKGPYKQYVKQWLDRTGRNTGSHPSVIAELVARIIETDNPRTRYTAGQYTWIILFRRIFGDRAYDWLLDQMMK